ncbi:MAG: hypothetical protein UX89_C0009G0030 [Parcubacteria group bacterium GW2011_GWA2_47_16]|nr:MAG: hypothetical protein UX89_C0009G0030 [Parcubacteria group bacterium GW2011_GWA2_47_16]
MTPEEKILLERAVHLGEENNKILRGIRRTNRLGFAWKIVYWAIIIGVSYGAYVYIQPYIDILMQEYAKIKGTVNSVQKTATQIPDLGKLLDGLMR